MKYIKPYNESKESIESICKEYGIKNNNILNYTINPDGSIDYPHSVYLGYKGISKLPLRFNKVKGNFDCSNNHLTSLEGCPKEVGGYFNCSDNQLTSLEGGPEVVGGNPRLSGRFNCIGNRLTSVRGLPEDFEGNLHLDDNPVFEIFKLFSLVQYQTDEWDLFFNFSSGVGSDFIKNHKIAQLLNEYDVISLDGKKVYRDSLEEVFNILGKEIPKDIKFKHYEIH